MNTMIEKGLEIERKETEALAENADPEEFQQEEEKDVIQLRTGRSSTTSITVALLAIGCVAAALSFMLWYTHASEAAVTVAQHSSAQQNNEELLEVMKQRLAPKSLYHDDNKTLYPHQFVHLHHMKTGGTSMDRLIHCGMDRLKNLGYNVPYYNIHECSHGRYERCVSGDDSDCRDGVDASAVMSFCAPLKDLEVFNWDPKEDPPTEFDHPIHAVTVLRHPVARVWSMYRFQTKSCYSCRELKDIYLDIENGKSTLTSMCEAQIMNHQTTNLLTRGSTGTEDELVKMAIDDMNQFFTVIGLTEDMATTQRIVGHAFPWLNETYESSADTCTLPHANASPSNNHCGPDNTHWDLPSVPDEETAALIMKHNQLDMRVYEAAVELFEKQKKALDL